VWHLKGPLKLIIFIIFAFVELEWRSVDETVAMPVQAKKEVLEKLLDKFDLCVTGRAFDVLRSLNLSFPWLCFDLNW